MKKGFLSVLKVIPTAILALLLAVTVWIVAMMQKDPTEERRFTNTVTVEVRGLGEGLVMTNVLQARFSNPHGYLAYRCGRYMRRLRSRSQSRVR